MSLHESSNSTVTSTNMDMTSNMLYQSAGMLLFMVIFLVMWSLGCKKNRLEHLQTPLLAYVQYIALSLYRERGIICWC